MLIGTAWYTQASESTTKTGISVKIKATVNMWPCFVETVLLAIGRNLVRATWRSNCWYTLSFQLYAALRIIIQCTRNKTDSLTIKAHQFCVRSLWLRKKAEGTCYCCMVGWKLAGVQPSLRDMTRRLLHSIRSFSNACIRSVSLCNGEFLWGQSL